MGSLGWIDIILIILIAGVCAAIIARGIRRRKRGETGCSCGCGCSDCAGCKKPAGGSSERGL